MTRHCDSIFWCQFLVPIFGLAIFFAFSTYGLVKREEGGKFLRVMRTSPKTKEEQRPYIRLLKKEQNQDEQEGKQVEDLNNFLRARRVEEGGKYLRVMRSDQDENQLQLPLNIFLSQKKYFRLWKKQDEFAFSRDLLTRVG